MIVVAAWWPWRLAADSEVDGLGLMEVTEVGDVLLGWCRDKLSSSWLKTKSKEAANFSGRETLIKVSKNGGTLDLEEDREEAIEEVQAPPKRSQDLRQAYKDDEDMMEQIRILRMKLVKIMML
ncbi:uncharacterized protein HKW66_Vig0140950 [Vigna angularis]|uniref:Uncharacterized protein n=1 Tax=Phaseolus angularis TaxID=3914 RepID=A0A8T0KEN9_PHAAN|nr:uncharacterized protein HKW66_Vig0140950 [Vigna angularis]